MMDKRISGGADEEAVIQQVSLDMLRKRMIEMGYDMDDVPDVLIVETVEKLIAERLHIKDC